MAQTRFWPRLASTVVAALGINIVAGFGVVWLATVVEEGLLAPKRYWAYESLMVTPAGEIQVTSTSYAGGQQLLSYRTLDGQPIETERLEALWTATLPDPRQTRWRHWPRPWSDRLRAASDARKFPGSAHWYMVADESGGMFFEGFADDSHMPLGYIGRKGFQATQPTGDDLFEMRRDPLGTYQVNSIYPNQYYGPQPEGDELMLPWRAQLVVGRDLLEVDLRTRTVRTCVKDLDALSIGVVNQTPPEEAAAVAEGGPAAPAVKKNPWARLAARLAARLVDRVVILDLRAGERSDFMLPAELQNAEQLGVSCVGDRELVVQVGDYNTALQRRISVYRIDRAGKILEQHRVDLAGIPPKDARGMMTVAAIGFPAPAAWAAMELGPAPFNHMEEHRATTYVEAVRRELAVAWPALVIAAVGGVAAAVWMGRLQHKYYRPHTAAWCIAALLLGPALVVAYLIEHRPAAMAKCAGCSRVVPRNRDVCAACGGAWPAPKMTGAEVFA